MNRLATITAFAALTTSAGAQVQFGPTEAGEPAIVAFKVINSNFEDADCPSVKEATRLKDGSVYAICSNGERFRVYGNISMKCSAAEKLGVAGCDNTPVPSIGPQQQTPMPPIGYGFPGRKPLDIVGIYPGMEYENALSIVSDYLQAVPKKFTRLNPTTGGLYVNEITGPWIDGGGERANFLTVWLSPTLAGNQVIGIARKLDFPGPKETSARAVFNSLKNKYGAPSRIYDTEQSFGESYKRSSAPPWSAYSIRWLFNANKIVDEKMKYDCLTTSLIPPPYGGRFVRFEATDADYYSRYSACGVVLDVQIKQYNDDIKSMDVLMIDLARISEAMAVAESSVEKKARAENKQKLPPPKL